MTVGYSRDDVAKFLPAYLQKGLLPTIPSPSSIGRVGELIRSASSAGG